MTKSEIFGESETSDRSYLVPCQKILWDADD